MPTVTLVGKCDLALAAAADGTFAKATAAGLASFTEIGATDLPDSGVTPTITGIPTSATVDQYGRITAIAADPDLTWSSASRTLGTPGVTISTVADHGVCEQLHNTGVVLPTTVPWGTSYEGYSYSGVVDNAHMEGWLQHQKVAGQPALWYQHESRWGPGAPPGGLLEWHRNYISIDGTVVYRPDGGSINLNTHASDYFAQNLAIWKLFGFGTGLDDPDPPVLVWNGLTGSLAAGTFSGNSFSGDGSALTGLNAANIASGTIPDARFPGFMTVDSVNHRLAINTTNFFDPPSGVDTIFKVSNVALTKSFGWTGDRISLDDGSGKKSIFGTGFVGSFTNTPFIVVTNSSPAATFGIDGSLTTVGPISTTNLTMSGVSIRVNTAGTYPLTLGAAVSDSFPCLWATPTPTLSNYLMLIDGPGGGVVLKQTNFAILQAGSNQLHITPTSMGFFGGTPAAKPTVAGSRGGNAALASLLTGLSALGLLTNSTTA